MSLDALRWLFVFGVLIHNAEEAIWLPRWSHNAGRWHPRVYGLEFVFAVAVLSIALIVCAAAASLSAAHQLSVPVSSFNFSLALALSGSIFSSAS